MSQELRMSATFRAQDALILNQLGADSVSRLDLDPSTSLRAMLTIFAILESRKYKQRNK